MTHLRQRPLEKRIFGPNNNRLGEINEEFHKMFSSPVTIRKLRRMNWADLRPIVRMKRRENREEKHFGVLDEDDIKNDLK
jgi:hypothetical protein